MAGTWRRRMRLWPWVSSLFPARLGRRPTIWSWRHLRGLAPSVPCLWDEGLRNRERKLAMRCSHQHCTGRHSGKWRIAELCPLAQDKRRASWLAYDERLYQSQFGSYMARFGDARSESVVNPKVQLDLRWHKRQFYRSMWAFRKRMEAHQQKLDALLNEGD
jgi:hypothetical protein